MFKTYKLSTLAAAAMLMMPMTAHAADRDFCRDYTDAALRQAREARSTEFCARGTSYDPARWSFDRRGHFEWCLSVPPDAALAERDARTHYLRECHRH